MNKQTFWALIGIIVLILIALFVYGSRTSAPVTGGQQASSTPAAFDQSVTNGPITFSFPSKDFGLAVNQQQILVHSYIPPCDSSFDYCLYYIGGAYTGTNFESAGLRIQKRADLSTERLCLNTPPAGYDASMQPTKTASSNTHSSSVFGNVGDAGAGHYAEGSLYRLFVRADSSCYEFETRVGQTQFANYPAGSIQQFTAADDAAVKTNLAGILARISVSGEQNLFAGL